MADITTPRILIVDLIGLAPDPAGGTDHSAAKAHVEARGGVFHLGSVTDHPAPQAGCPHFYYMPMLSTEAELLAEAGDGRYDAVIAAATLLPAATQFELGGVRIGAGTGNMRSASWGGGDGLGGVAPLMNTPGINARATAQMVMKAVLRVRPDLPVEAMNDLVAEGNFDTGRDLVRFPTAKLEGQVFAVIGYGNIGREVAKLARAFGMRVRVHARPRHRDWIESEGFDYADSPMAAATGADVISVHIGLGALGPDGYANAGLIGAGVMAMLSHGAVLVNYDRGELVDTTALADALASGQIDHAAIDADLFRDLESGTLSGPMLPYIDLLPTHRANLSLLPHAAADTDHPTRVAGAIQAIDQILDAIQKGQVRNLKGDLPDGLTNAGGTRPHGMGGISANDLKHLSGEAGKLDTLASLATDLARHAQDLKAGAVDQLGRDFVMTCNRLAQMLRASGLEGPYLG